MKKIFMGLVALSTLSFAVNNVTGTESPADESSVFLGNQKGKIFIQTTLQSKLSDVKYVVFTSANGDLTGATDTLVLPTFTVTSDAGACGFGWKTPNKIYVKRLDSSNAIQNLTPSEVVTFTTAGFDPSYTTQLADALTAPSGDWVYTLTQFIDRATLEPIAQKAVDTIDDITAFTLDDWGVLKFTTTSAGLKNYTLPKTIALNSPENGVLEVKEVTDANYPGLAADLVDSVSKLFDAPVTSTMYITVTING